MDELLGQAQKDRRHPVGAMSKGAVPTRLALAHSGIPDRVRIVADAYGLDDLVDEFADVGVDGGGAGRGPTMTGWPRRIVRPGTRFCGRLGGHAFSNAVGPVGVTGRTVSAVVAVASSYAARVR
ncbi:hypothetical protein ACGFYQ_39820 [Streptomyces sp. NPDC048258]|uniref:hypothetical protein n=1 Tax=Streptomyces sp. NPDC048258 TaxID=3365527 RepID=UPI0037182BA6